MKAKKRKKAKKYKRIPTLAWTLPRPRRPFYHGGFPMWFEKKLLELYGWPEKVLHTFGGRAEYGMRIDLRLDMRPDLVANAHALPFRDNSFDMVISDPPYSNELSAKLYGTGGIKFQEWSREAVRVCKSGGFVVQYHVNALPRPAGTKSHKRILLFVRMWHPSRYVGIFRKI